MSGTGDLDWDDLRYFLRATEQKTLAGAARALRVEHTTIGRRLTALERALGAPLVLRGPDGLRLTPLGETLEPLARDVERAVLTLTQAAAANRSRVRLAVPTGLSQLFTERIDELKRQRPGLVLEISSGARRVDLSRGEADIAVRIGPIDDPNLVARKLCESGWSLYAAQSYLARRPAPENPDDLSGHEVIGFDSSLANVPAAQWLEQRLGDAAVVVRSHGVTDMLSAAVSGAGIAALPCFVADAEPALRRLTPAVIATGTVSLVYRRETRLSEEIRAVVRFVIDVVGAQAERMSGRAAPVVTDTRRR